MTFSLYFHPTWYRTLLLRCFGLPFLITSICYPMQQLSPKSVQSPQSDLLCLISPSQSVYHFLPNKLTQIIYRYRRMHPTRSADLATLLIIWHQVSLSLQPTEVPTFNSPLSFRHTTNHQRVETRIHCPNIIKYSQIVHFLQRWTKRKWYGLTKPCTQSTVYIYSFMVH